MLKASSPTLLQDGVSVSAARLVLEILTIYETFGEFRPASQYMGSKAGLADQCRLSDDGRGADVDEREMG